MLTERAVAVINTERSTLSIETTLALGAFPLFTTFGNAERVLTTQAPLTIFRTHALAVAPALNAGEACITVTRLTTLHITAILYAILSVFAVAVINTLKDTLIFETDLKIKAVTRSLALFNAATGFTDKW